MIGCAVPRTLDVGSPSNLLVVEEEEFSHAVTLLNRDVPTYRPTSHADADFQYVLVSKLGTVQSGPFSDEEAIKLFEDLAQYFQKRQPGLRTSITVKSSPASIRFLSSSILIRGASAMGTLLSAKRISRCRRADSAWCRKLDSGMLAAQQSEPASHFSYAETKERRTGSRPT